MTDTPVLDGEVLPPNGDGVRVVAAHHPFRTERTDRQMIAGLTLAEMLERAQPDPVLRRHARILVGDWEVPRENWHLVRPKPGATVTIRVLPHGGGGGDKNVLRTVLSIAVIAAAVAVSAGALGPKGLALLGSSFAQGGTGALIASAAISVVGSLAINALIPPSQPQLSDLSGASQDSPSLSIRGGRNRANRFGAIPRPLGRHRMYPPLASDYVTEIEGDDQYLRMAVCWGYGPLRIDNIKIGETPIENFDDLQIRTHQGFSKIERIPFLPNIVDERQLAISLRSSEGYSERTTEPEADEISVDLTFPKGLVVFDDRGNKKTREVRFEVQYAEAGTSNWKGTAKSVSVGSQTEKVADGGIQLVVIIFKFFEIVGVLYVDRSSGSLGVDSTTRPIGSDGLPFAENTGDPATWVPKDKLIVGTFSVTLDFDVSGDSITVDGIKSTINDRRSFGDQASGFQPSISVDQNTGVFVSVEKGVVTPSLIRVRGRQTNALRRNVRFEVPRGQYDVRVRRVTPDSNDNQVFDSLAWTALRTITNEPPITFDEPVAITSLRIRATDQLNGVIDQLNADVTAILPDWNGSSWVERPTVNPASAFREVLTGNANARALATSRVDDATLQDWHDFCEAEAFAYNFPGDAQTSVQRKLSDIAQAGRAAPTIRDGKWSVIIDRERTTPVQHFTPRNSWGFEGQKVFPELPDGFRVRFPNEEEGYEQDERIVYDDGFDASNATKFEGLEFAGVTDPAQVYKLGRYHIATARLRPEIYTFNADIEHIVCTRGDLIRVTHDVPLWGLDSGRVKAVQDDGGSPAQATGVTVDETFTMEAGKTYDLRFRLADGSTLVKTIDTDPGDQTTLTFSTPFDLTDAPEAGDLVMFGETGQESVELVVKSIEPGENLTAKLTCVDHSPAIYQADQGKIPAFDSQISGGPLLPVPQIVEIRSDESALQRTPTGLIPRVLISVQGINDDIAELDAQIRTSGTDGSYRPAAVQSSGSDGIAITDVDDGETYDIRIRWNRENRFPSGWAEINSYKVIGRTSPPSALSGFTISVFGGQAYFRWDPIPDIDVRVGGYIEFRHSPKFTGASWSTSTSIARAQNGIATSAQLPLKPGTYFARPVDSLGIPAPTVVSATTRQASLISFATTNSVTEQTAFSGTKTDVVVDSGSLKLSGAQLLDSVADFDSIADLDALGGISETGTYEFAGSIDLGSVQDARATSHIDATVINELDQIDNRQRLIDDWQDFDGTEAASADAYVEVRHTDDDPTGTPTWSEWERLDSAEINARAFQFRAQLSSDDSAYNIRIDELEATVDAP